ncbi:hypothetical protein P152DRAFT_516846 [Eremomyces bilateralis CBS 781.70]|uniref:Uncharacterized protein n=1 Tax=Eremomyces bilateralis CBS 781.70 TaxID=1392243 RepID=A0A6G1FU53_9PEZI|nr:uncharacterized protein P152DRAFT_516846 [Eremomyces bilateralis CBS 781.70]KAF1809238.1 hypothetical protein P152DRAFT_516846 [Eremomyces bilateralis CBS 781.70]
MLEKVRGSGSSRPWARSGGSYLFTIDSDQLVEFEPEEFFIDSTLSNTVPVVTDSAVGIIRIETEDGEAHPNRHFEVLTCPIRQWNYFTTSEIRSLGPFCLKTLSPKHSDLLDADTRNLYACEYNVPDFLVALCWITSRARYMHGYPGWSWLAWNGPDPVTLDLRDVSQLTQYAAKINQQWDDKTGQFSAAFEHETKTDPDALSTQATLVPWETFQLEYGNGITQSILSDYLHIYAWMVDLRILSAPFKTDDWKGEVRIVAEDDVTGIPIDV